MIFSKAAETVARSTAADSFVGGAPHLIDDATWSVWTVRAAVHPWPGADKSAPGPWGRARSVSITSRVALNTHTRINAEDNRWQRNTATRVPPRTLRTAASAVTGGGANACGDLAGFIGLAVAPLIRAPCAELHARVSFAA